MNSYTFSDIPFVTEPTLSIESVNFPNTGTTATVLIKIENVTNLGGIDVWLTYDKNVVIVEDVAEGTLGGITTGIDNIKGEVRMNWFSVAGITGNFEFAKVTLKAIGAVGTTSNLTLVLKEIIDIDGEPIVTEIINGIASVNAKFGILDIKSVPAGASIFIDNKDTSLKTNVIIPNIVVGTHTVLLKLNGYVNYIDNNVVITEGVTTSKTYTLVAGTSDTWECENNICTKKTDGSGQYPTLEACQDAKCETEMSLQFDLVSLGLIGVGIIVIAYIITKK